MIIYKGKYMRGKTELNKYKLRNHLAKDLWFYVLNKVYRECIRRKIVNSLVLGFRNGVLLKSGK